MIRVLKAIGAVLACIGSGLVVGIALAFGAKALGAPPSDFAAIIDLWPLWGSVVGVMWLWRRSARADQ